jgi:O-antigen/teichoic acid export membrane protein
MRRAIADVLRISGSVAFAQVIAVAAVPLMTRLYDPAAFGQFAVFNAVLALLGPLVAWRYEMALLLPQDETQAFDLLALCLGLVTSSSIGFAMVGPLLSPVLVRWVGIGPVEVFLLSLAMFAVGLNAVMTSWLVRRSSFGQVARIRFITIVGGLACQIALGTLYGSATGLILGFCCGYLLGVAFALCSCERAVLEGIGRTRLGGVQRAAVAYRSFALITAPSGIVNAVGAQGPSLVLPLLYGTSVTGQFSLAHRLLSQPMVLAGLAAKQVFWGNAARLVVENPAGLWPLFLKLNLCLLAMMAPGFVLTWAGPQIFRFLFGPSWEQAGQFAGVLVVASFIGLAAYGTTSLEVHRLNHWMAAWEFMRLVLVASALATAAWMGLSPVRCIVAMTAAATLSNAVLLGLNARAAWCVRAEAYRSCPVGGVAPVRREPDRAEG